MNHCVCVCGFFHAQNKGKLRIHEDSMGNIYVAGATEVKVSSQEEVLHMLWMIYIGEMS